MRFNRLMFRWWDIIYNPTPATSFDGPSDPQLSGCVVAVCPNKVRPMNYTDWQGEPSSPLQIDIFRSSHFITRFMAILTSSACVWWKISIFLWATSNAGHGHCRWRSVVPSPWWILHDDLWTPRRVNFPVLMSTGASWVLSQSGIEFQGRLQDNNICMSA